MRNNIIKSYPKINLFLLVKKTNKELHKIKSVFLLDKSIYDEIEIYESSENKIEYFDKNDKKIKVDNCIVKKTLFFLKEKYNISKKYLIKIKKNIPIGSGLGGASSNSACIIKYILENEKIKYTNIFKSIHSLGSDIAFFLKNIECAFVYGYGNKIKEIILPKIKYKLFINENVKCSTKDVYNEFDKLENNKSSYRKQLQYLYNNQYDKLKNDLEIPCLKIYNNIKCIKEELDKKYITKLSGSGSTFILFNKE